MPDFNSLHCENECTHFQGVCGTSTAIAGAYVRDLSITNVDKLPESVNEMLHPKKKRVSDISIFKAEEFNAGDPFAQMKSDEVDEFYGEDDAP